MNIQEHFVAKKYAQAFLNLFINSISLDDYYNLVSAEQFLTIHKKAFFFLSLSHIEQSTKIRLLEKVMQKFGVVLSINNLVRLLLNDKRLFLLGEIVRQLCSLYRKRKNIELFSIVSSHALQEKDLSVIQQFLATNTGCDIMYTYTVDTRLIAGVRVQSDLLVWEYSIAKQLRDIQLALIH